MPSSGTGEEAEPRRAACPHLRQPCVPGCAFAPFFPPGDQTFAVVREAFGSEELTRMLLRERPDQRAEVAQALFAQATRLLDRRLAARAQQQQQTSAAAGGTVVPPPPWGGVREPRAAQFLPGDESARFAAVHVPAESGVALNLQQPGPQLTAGAQQRPSASATRQLGNSARFQKEEASSSGSGEDADSRCQICILNGLPCGLKCACSMYFARGDFAGVEEVYGSKAVGNSFLSPGAGQDLASRRNHAVGLVICAQEQLKSRGLPWRRQCTACQRLRCNCREDCVFAPHFPPDDDVERFNAVVNIYGLRKFATLLRELPPERRSDAAASFVSQALHRIADPEYFDDNGVANTLFAGTWTPGQEAALTRFEWQLAAIYLATGIPRLQEPELMTANVRNFVEVLPAPYPAEDVGQPADAAPPLPMQQTPPQVPTAAAGGVQDAGLPEAEDASDKSTGSS